VAKSWRVGTKVPINVYEGPVGDSRPICQCHTVEDAHRIVTAMRLAEFMIEGGWTRAHLESIARAALGLPSLVTKEENHG
jgi:hypothetical protein